MPGPIRTVLVILCALLVTSSVVQPSLQPSLGVHAEERPRAFSCVVHAIMRWEAEAIPAGRRQAVETEASAIWGRLGIDLRWGSDSPERGGIIVSVVVTDRVQRLGPEGRVAELGWVEFSGSDPSRVLYASAGAAMAVSYDSREHSGVLADRPQELVVTVALRLLGRAVAHELGHYLLAARGHATRGLMRRRFAVWEALMPGLDRYGLTGDQVRALRRRLDSLSANAAPPGV